MDTTIYVDVNASGAANGTNWTDAYTTVQDAIAVAISGDEIWVAEGVYYPDEGSGQINDMITSTFVLTDGVSVYGGFAGYGINETLLTERDWKKYVTILSGDIDKNDVNTDGNFIAEYSDDLQGNNAFNVVVATSVTNATIFDGFTITAGYANEGTSYFGGGMVSSNSDLVLKNIICSGNSASRHGGGMQNVNSNPVLRNVTFVGNSSGVGGGAMSNLINSTPVLMDVIFIGNSANTSGGMININSNPSLTNVIFSGNTTNWDGGGIYNNNSHPSLINVTLSGNSADIGGGIFNTCSNPELSNVILWGNTATNTVGIQIANQGGSIPIIGYSDIQGSGGSLNWDSTLGTDIGGNVDAHPTFWYEPQDGGDGWGDTNDNYGDLHLNAGSPAIDTGTNWECPATDLDGNPRPVNVLCDMGAYEYDLIKIFLPLVVR